MSRLLVAALAMAIALPVPAVTITPALANYSCEPGQPNCIPMDQIGKQQSHDTPWPEIACRIPGDKNVDSDDLRFTNVGDVLIPGGTRIYWHLMQTGEHGNFVLPQDLPVMAEIDDADILEGALPGRTRCRSRLDVNV